MQVDTSIVCYFLVDSPSPKIHALKKPHQNTRSTSKTPHSPPLITPINSFFLYYFTSLWFFYSSFKLSEQKKKKKKTSSVFFIISDISKTSPIMYILQIPYLLLLSFVGTLSSVLCVIIWLSGKILQNLFCFFFLLS